jgi:hypothetical protein
MNNKKSLFAAAVAAACAFTGAPAFADDDARSIAVFGDWPYSQALLDNAQGLINSVNGDRDVKLVMHVGDIHSGSMACTGAGLVYDQLKGGFTRNGALLTIPGVVSATNKQVVNPAWNIHIYGDFQKFNQPVIYTPGDNEWADCHKQKQFYSGAPLLELAAVRELFFAHAGESLGQRTKRVTSQADAFDPAHPSDSQFVENVMWSDEGVVYVTFNQPGGSNDDTDSWTSPFTDAVAQAQERVDRDGANLRWLDAAFDLAARRGARAVVIGLQADMWDTEKTAKLSNFTPFVTELATRSLAFKRPVLLLNGDSHVYKADQPLVPSTGVVPTDGCASTAACDLSLIHNTPAVPNFRRIVVEGSGVGQHWLKLTIDTESKDVFSWVNVAY